MRQLVNRGGWNVGGVHVRVKEVSHDRCHVWHVNNACTSVMARLWTYTTSSGEERNLVTLLECGELYEYTVPSFPVISVELRRMKYESIMPDGKSTKVVDGFIREDASLKRSFPGTLPFERPPFRRPTGVSIAIPYPIAISCSPAPLYYALFF